MNAIQTRGGTPTARGLLHGEGAGVAHQRPDLLLGHHPRDAVHEERVARDGVHIHEPGRARRAGFSDQNIPEHQELLYITNAYSSITVIWHLYFSFAMIRATPGRTSIAEHR